MLPTSLLLGASLLAAAVTPGLAAAQAPPPPQPAPSSPPPVYRAPEEAPSTATHLGLGYKLGNGLGFLGADVIVSPVPHLALDLQANTFSYVTLSGTAHGYGLAPGVQAYLREPGVSTPYVGAGFVYATLSLSNVRASVSGVFANAGYEWKWPSGFGILLGGGISYLGTARATDGFTTIERPGGASFNLEFGVRTMLF